MIIFKHATRSVAREHMTSSEASSAAKSTPQELTSILSQVQNLQTDRERLMKELEEAKEKMGKLQVDADFCLLACICFQF